MLVNLKSNNTPGAKLPTTKFRLFIADITDVDINNWPEPTIATISTDVLVTDIVTPRSWKYLDCKVGSMKPNAAPGESPLTGKLTLTPQIEGITKESLACLYDNNGRRVIVVWERCADRQKFIGGSPCSGGLEIKMSSIGDLDGGSSGIALTFEGGDCPEPFYFYDFDAMVIAPDA